MRRVRQMQHVRWFREGFALGRDYLWTWCVVSARCHETPAALQSEVGGLFCKHFAASTACFSRIAHAGFIAHSILLALHMLSFLLAYPLVVRRLRVTWVDVWVVRFRWLACGGFLLCQLVVGTGVLDACWYLCLAGLLHQITLGKI